MGRLRGQVEGVCGDFNDDPSDDLTHAVSGEVVADPEDFVDSWRTLGFNDRLVSWRAREVSVYLNI